MTTVSPAPALVVSDRFNHAFSENGHWAVCLRTGDEGLVLERWTLGSEEAACRAIADVAVDRATTALPLDDGGILVFHGDGADTSERRELTLLQSRDGGFHWQRLGDVPALFGSYLLPSPSAAPFWCVVTIDDPEHSTIWRVSASPPRIDPTVQVPGLLSGGVWLDGDNGVVAVNQTCASEGSSGIAVDLRQGSWRRIWFNTKASTDRIALYSPSSKLLVVTTNASGEERIGWALLGQPTVRFPETLHRPGYARSALALDDRGERLLVRETEGPVSRLLVYTPADDRLESLAGPPGVIWPPASWHGDLLRFPFSAPSHPPTLATVRLGPPVRWSLSRDSELGSEPAWAQAELVELPGPTGSIEAVVYGSPDWRQREQLVVALHGGPLDSSRFEFDPLFQGLAAAGVAVVAPNYRGSTGYGSEHLRAVIGNWGGPDLEDVLHLGRGLVQSRDRLGLPRPILLGASYGAFLALLAACESPELWSACVALAPLLSGPRLHAGSNSAVRDRLEKLGALSRVDEASRPRDVLRICASLSAPLLLIHGTRDVTIPVEQSRMLRRRLCELGRTEGADFEYLEVDGDHTDVTLAATKALRERVIRFCLTRPRLEQKTVSC